jgi:hypothetical protein
VKKNHRFPVFLGVSILLAIAIFTFVGLVFAAKPARQTTTLPNFAAPAKAEGLYSGCVVESANNQWVIFKPVWKYGAKVYALNWAQPAAKPSLVSESKDVTGQWALSSENSAHVAIAQFFKDGNGKVEVFSLSDNKLVGSYLTKGAPQLESFNSSQLIFFTLVFGGEKTWHLVEPKNGWTEQTLKVVPPNRQGNFQIPEAVSALQTRATFCQSWQN